MKTLKELRAMITALTAKNDSLLKDVDAESGLLSEENQTAFDANLSTLDSLEAQYSRQEKQTKIAINNDPIDEPVISGNVSNPHVTNNEPVVDPMAGFNSFAEFGLAVKTACAGNGQIDSRLEDIYKIAGAGTPTNFHKEGGAAEGFMIPPEMNDKIFQYMNDDLSLFNMTSPEPTSSNSVQFISDESTPWSATGIQANWAAEGSQFSPTKLETKSSNLKLNKLYAFVTATDEILEDAALLSSRITKGASEALVFKASDAVMNGTGAGQPLGFMNSGSLVTVAKEISQVADTIVADNVAKMYSRMLPEGLNDAVWLINSDALPQFQTMTIGNHAIWTPPSTGFANAPGGFLFGRPIIQTQHNTTVGDLGDIVFASLGQGYYSLIKQGGVKFDSSIHLYFDHGISSFRFSSRIAGTTWLSAAQAQNKGSNTKSHFVTLAERA